MRFIKISLLSAVFAFMLGCSSEPEVTIIDLNKVLDVMIDTFDQMSAKMGSTQVASTDETAKTQYMQEFNTLYTSNLNKAQVYPKPIATEVKSDGSFSGFVDENQNLKQDAGEAQLFTVEVDSERSRLIATDTTNGYRRDGGFSLGGLATGLLIGHLLSRQSAAGVNTSNFSKMQMSPKDYHANATSSAKARSGSGSFKSGK